MRLGSGAESRKNAIIQGLASDILGGEKDGILRFLLYEVHDVVSLTRFETYKEYDGKMLEMILKAAAELAEGLRIFYRCG
jgi:hypothetical protein